MTAVKVVAPTVTAATTRTRCAGDIDDVGPLIVEDVLCRVSDLLWIRVQIRTD
jgi:hypothetical protein